MNLKSMKGLLIVTAFLAMGFAMRVHGQGPLFIPAAGSPVAVGEGSGRIVLADVNRDGRLDLVTQHLQSHVVAVQLGDGTGRFAYPRRWVEYDRSVFDWRYRIEDLRIWYRHGPRLWQKWHRRCGRRALATVTESVGG